MMPLPVGVSVAISNRSGWPASSNSFAVSNAVRRFPAVQSCSAMSLSLTSRAKPGSGIATGPPLTWNDTLGLEASTCSAHIPDQPGLEDDRTGVDAHAARPIVEEAGARSEGKRLDTRRIFRPAWHMNFGSR